MNILAEADLGDERKLIIRTYEPADYDVIQNNLIAEQMFNERKDSAESLRLMTTTEPHSVLVATVDREIAGSLYILISGHWATINRFVVAPRFRGRGVAEKLLQTAEEILKQRGIREVGLFYRADKAKLGTFYMRQGWQTLPGFHQAMWKDL